MVTQNSLPFIMTLFVFGIDVLILEIRLSKQTYGFLFRAGHIDALCHYTKRYFRNVTVDKGV